MRHESGSWRIISSQNSVFTYFTPRMYRTATVLSTQYTTAKAKSN
jgi:hypothetical protein